MELTTTGLNWYSAEIITQKAHANIYVLLYWKKRYAN